VSPDLPGVSFVLPVLDGERWLAPVLDAVLAQDDGRPFEVLIIDDGSHDDSRAIAERFLETGRARLVEGPGRGAAAALNLGISQARHPLVAQVDQDVILDPGWLALLAAELDEPSVAAAQGYYRTDPTAPLWERIAGRELETRYARIRAREVDHVCTGNSLYRAEALRQVGLFDESMGYGYDNDMSYRLAAAGHRLVFCRQARSVHRWRRGLVPYLRQQYGLGYGRLDLVAKHPQRLAGDQVSGLGMILHVPIMLGVLAAAGISVALAASGMPWSGSALLALGLLALLMAERAVVGIRAAVRFSDLAGLLLPLAHVARDLAWVAALLTWAARRLTGRRPSPGQSMDPG